MVDPGHSMLRDRIENASLAQKSSVDEIGSTTGRDKLPCTLSPRFALTIVVRWHSGVTLDDGMLKAKTDQVNSRAFTASPKNIYGLENGTILCYWETEKNQLAKLIRAYLSKKTTQERMRSLDVLSITFHTDCRIRLSPEPFRSRILDSGKVTVYRFKATTSTPDVPSLTPSMSPMPKLCDEPKPSNSAKTWRKNEVRHEISTSQPSPTRSQQTEFVSESSLISQGRSGSDGHLPPRGPRAKAMPQKPCCNGGSAPSPSSVAHSSTSQKRPYSPPDTDENDIGGKRPRSAACSFDRDPASVRHMQSELSRRSDKLHDIPTSRSPSREVRGYSRARSNNMHQVHDDTKLDLRRGGEAEKHTLRRDDELESRVDKLRGRIRNLEEAYESSKKEASRLREALEESESAKKSLREGLQSVQSDYKELQLRETELQQALHGALQDLEEARKYGSKAEQELREERSLAEIARKIAEEDRAEVMDRLRMAEEALATEQLQRRAVEETFLDLKCVLSGIDVFSGRRD